MTRVESIRGQINTLVKATPFRPFVLILESGQQVIIEHPENIAFNAGSSNGTAIEELFVVDASGLSESSRASFENRRSHPWIPMENRR